MRKRILRGDFISRLLIRKFSIWEILLLQAFAAIGILLESFVPIPATGMMISFAIMLWAAYRLREIPYFSMLNPMTIGVFTSLIAAAIYLVASLFYEPLQQTVGKPSIRNAISILFIAAIYGIVAGFFAMFIVAFSDPKDENEEDP